MDAMYLAAILLLLLILPVGSTAIEVLAFSSELPCVSDLLIAIVLMLIAWKAFSCCRGAEFTKVET
jgi:hypothetical protein